MRVRISTNSPLPPVKAWFPLNLEPLHSKLNISNFKSTLCLSISAFHGLSPGSLRLSIDGFELLDSSELSIVRDGDLICVDALDVAACDRDVSRVTQTFFGPGASRKRKRRMSSPSSSSSESGTGSESESESASDTDTDTETSDSESESDLDGSSRPTTLPAQPRPRVVHPSTFVPPGYGKPQTRSRNLRRRLRRMHEREAVGVSQGGPVSGANAVVGGKNARVQPTMPAVPGARRGAHTIPALPSLSLRNKNKAKNFRSLMGRPLPAKIVFGDQEGDASGSTSGAIDTPECLTSQALPRLIPPSSRSSLPPNMFVTSVDVEAGLHREQTKGKTRIGCRDGPEEQTEGDVDTAEPEVDVDRLQSAAYLQWDALVRPTRERRVQPGMLVGYKGLGINPATYTPEQVVTVGRVVLCGGEAVVVRPLRGVSFGGPVEGMPEEHTWDEIERGDWRVIEE